MFDSFYSYFANYYSVKNEYNNIEVENLPVTEKNVSLQFENSLIEENNFKEENNLNMTTNESLMATAVSDMEKMLFEENELLKAEDVSFNETVDSLETSSQSEIDMGTSSNNALIDISDQVCNLLI